MPPGLPRLRLAPEVFDLPVEKMRAGWYTDAYFNHARAALLADGRHPNVVVQVFQKNQAWLGGMDEAIAILRLCSHEPEGLTIRALYDGDRIEPWETVLVIEGDYTTFAHLETVYLGTLARRTLITTNVVHVLEAANGKPIIFMPARHDHQRVQAGDGYAAYVAGRITGFEIGVTSEEQASWWGGRAIGTVPHSLIAAYGGDTVLAARKFAEWAPPDMSVTVLVDFENDSVRTALEVAEALGERLWGVRLDTSRGARRPLPVGRDGGLQADRRERAARPEGAGRARRCRFRPGADRRLRRLHRREDQRLRGARRAGGRLRRRLFAHPRRERLHRRRGRDGRAAVGEVRPAPARQPAVGGRHLSLRVVPVTSQRWEDMCTLFGQRGLGLVVFRVLPHDNEPERRTHHDALVAANPELDFIRLSDDQAVLVLGDAAEVVDSPLLA